MTRMRYWVLALCGALALLPPAAAPAWAGPPVPVPPPRYAVPLWPVPEPGPRQARPAAPAGHRPAVGRPPRPSGPHSRQSAARQLVAAVNRQRRRAGCSSVRLHPVLGRAARAHSAEMARHHRLTHTGAGGSTPAGRMRAAGYHLRSGGEAVTAGPATARGAVTVWMRSPAHRAVLLRCAYRHAGVGVAAGGGGPWWTLDLASGH
ncbi:hypothetical protein GCM10010129_02990 [Streptomyces fumigatiscleroticus]|nr:hypothetical protein GCM10010129_02990 [Streptomyces fumigatiscleroticus]